MAYTAGVAPASRPQFALVVVMNDPSNGSYYGGAVSAPVFSQIMGDVLRLENVMPDGMPQGAENLIVMHDSHRWRRRCNSGLQGRIALHFRPFSDTGAVMSYSCPFATRRSAVATTTIPARSGTSSIWRKRGTSICYRCSSNGRAIPATALR